MSLHFAESRLDGRLNLRPCVHELHQETTVRSVRTVRDRAEIQSGQRLRCSVPADDADGSGNGPTVRVSPLKTNAGAAAGGADANCPPQFGLEETGPARWGGFERRRWPGAGGVRRHPQSSVAPQDRHRDAHNSASTLIRMRGEEKIFAVKGVWRICQAISIMMER